MLAVLRVAPLLPSPTLRAVARMMPGRDGEAGSLIELESRVWVPLTEEAQSSSSADDVPLLRPADAISLRR
jgi:hypothetical protein